MTNQYHRDVLLLREPREASTAFTNLSHRARSAPDLGDTHSLNRVDYQYIRTQLLGSCNDGINILLCEEEDIIVDHIEPTGPQPHLILGLLGSGDQHLSACSSKAPGYLEEQGRLADTGFATHEHN
jgi:hypothetical protein